MLGKESPAQRERVKNVAPPQKNATIISCVRFLTNYEVGGKIMTQEKALGTISCERKMNI